MFISQMAQININNEIEMEMNDNHFIFDAIINNIKLCLLTRIHRIVIK
mgnify:CR=1 FL=1